MKEAKEACSFSRPPKPNLKNKKFVNWTKAESSKQEDNLVSSVWHEKLKTVPPFLPAYDNKPVNMIYLLSGEYGRLWTKERDAWYRKVFVLKPKEKDMAERQKKIRQEIREARKAAEESILERKVRREKEIEAKKKAEAEKIEKLKLKVLKLKATKQPPKTSKKSQASSKSTPEPPKQRKAPVQVEPAAQTCECSDHNKETGDTQPSRETNETENKEPEPETEINQARDSGKACTMCEGYIKQLEEVYESKCKVKELNTENEKAE